MPPAQHGLDAHELIVLRVRSGDPDGDREGARDGGAVYTGHAEMGDCFAGLGWDNEFVVGVAQVVDIGHILRVISIPLSSVDK